MFHCPELYERVVTGKGRHYHVAEGPLFPFIILQDSTRHWTLHAAAASDEEMATLFAHSMAMPLPFEMLSVNEWTQHLLCADRFADGRVFIAGDAAHLLIPTGGLGMNTGVGDATDLAWKLGARWPVGRSAPVALVRSGAATDQRAQHRGIGRGNGRRETWRAATTQAEMARRFDVEQRKVTEILGIEAGYQYVDSPIVFPESGERPDPNNRSYVPTSWPGRACPTCGSTTAARCTIDWAADSRCSDSAARGRTRLVWCARCGLRARRWMSSS